jgi:hypothetical protein
MQTFYIYLHRLKLTCLNYLFAHFILIGNIAIGKKMLVPPRFELGSLDSKSRVLTITPWNLLWVMDWFLKNYSMCKLNCLETMFYNILSLQFFIPERQVKRRTVPSTSVSMIRIMTLLAKVWPIGGSNPWPSRY